VPFPVQTLVLTRLRGLLAAAMLVVWAAPGAGAQAAREFDIAPAPLGEALQAFIAQSDVQILFAPDRVQGRHSAGFRGRAQPGEALSHILSGTGLVHEFVARDVVAIRDRTVRGAVQPATGAVSQPISRTLDDGPLPAERIIVTGRRGQTPRDRLALSYAVSTIDTDALELAAARTPASLLGQVPGFWVEASGGEASNNVRSRGVPGDGYASVGVLEDGLPVQHDPGLAFLNADQFFRLGPSTARIEVVRGGPSALFTANAPGGVVNLVPREAGDSWAGLLDAETGDFGLVRTGLWAGGPLGGWRIGAGGFYRRDDGVRDPGYTANEGGQFGVRLQREAAGDGVSVTLAYRRLDDNVAFFLPIPLALDAGGGVHGVAGLDPNYGTLNGPALTGLDMPLGDGSVEPFDLAAGTGVVLDQLTASLSFPLAGWQVEPRLRLRRSDTRRHGLFPGTPELAGARIGRAEAAYLDDFPGLSALALRRAGDGSLLSAEDGQLVMDAAASIVEAPLDETIAEISAVRREGDHDLSVTAYFAASEAALRRDAGTLMIEARHRAGRLELVGLDASGAVIADLAPDGWIGAGAQYDRAEGRQDYAAIAVSDEWSFAPGWRLDGALRWETSRIEGRSERVARVDGGDPALIRDDRMLTGLGVDRHFEADFDQLSWTLGLDRRLSPDTGVFARYTDVGRLPGISHFWSHKTDVVPRVQDITLAELGYKRVGETWSVFATGFVSDFSGYRLSETTFDPASGALVERAVYASTRTYGIELEAAVDLAAGFGLRVRADLQRPRFRDFRYGVVEDGGVVIRDISDNHLLRVPDTTLHIMPVWDSADGRLRLQLPVTHFSARYADAANSLRLPAYTVVGFNAEYRFNDALRLRFVAENLTNEIGLTEANPRAGQLENAEADAGIITARPILGRHVRASLRYEF